MSQHIAVRKEGHVMTVGFDRPEKKNAISIEMYEALVAAFDEYAADDGLRALVMHGTADTYTAGNDLMGFLNAMQQEGEPPALKLMRRVEEAEKPSVAAVEGWCVGIGATLLLHTDLVYAGRSAKLKMPFTELGIVPEAGASRPVTRRFGRQAAGEFLLLSEAVSAQRAYDIGLVNEVVEDGGALDRAMQAAERLCQMSPTSVRMSKRLMREDESLVPHMEKEMAQIAERVRSDEMRERVTAMMAARAQKSG
jgi:enoyl-CoA hydratase/carnithine racemase